MNADIRTLWRELQQRGFLDAATTESPDAAVAARERPWYIGLLLGLSGWIAGLFLLGFVALLFHPDTAAASAIAGAVLLAAAWGLFVVDRDGVFVAQFALALSIAGQCLMLFAISEHLHGIGAVAARALLLQIALAWLMPNRLHRTLSTFFATIAWALTVRFALFGEPVAWRGVGDMSVGLVPALAAWCVAWLPVGALLAWLIRGEPSWMARRWQATVRPALAGLVTGLAFATLASYPLESLRWFESNGAARTNWLALWPVLSAGAALGGVAAAFALRSRALMGACAAAALLHVSHFYYALGTSLLTKSLLMLAMGAVLLVFARTISRSEIGAST